MGLGMIVDKEYQEIYYSQSGWVGEDNKMVHMKVKQALIAIAAFGTNDHFRYNRTKFL